jgi:hypothetical protein
VSLRPWLYVAACDLARDTRGVAGRFVLLASAIAALSAFAAALPAYRDSFTAGVAAAGFDVDVAGCACDSSTMATLRALPGASHVAGVLGLLDVPLQHDARSAVAGFGWAIDASADGVLTPIGPQRLLEGTFDLGTAAAPKVVLDRELADSLGVGPGDTVELKIGGRLFGFAVAGVTGSAARFRGPSFAVLRSVVAPYVPPDPDLVQFPYTEVLIAGSTLEEVQQALKGEKAAIYSKAEQIAALESQIEVSQPVIQVVSALSAAALLAVLVFAASLAIERRRGMLSLLPHLGASRGETATAVLVVEGAPLAVATAIGVLVGLIGIMGIYFARISVYADPAFAAEAAVTMAFVALGLVMAAFIVRGRAVR